MGQTAFSSTVAARQVSVLRFADKIQIEFPIREQIEEHKFLDKVDGKTISVTYQCVFRGNTLANILPRTVGLGYPFHERSYLRNSPAVCHDIPYFSARVLDLRHRSVTAIVITEL